eukprot:s3196_g2.t1
MTEPPGKKPKVGARELTTLRLGDAALSIDAAGGSLASFQLGQGPNPLCWDSAVHDNLDPTVTEPRPLGHFLCLDRWGPPSEEEERQGMPYHGEATSRHWHWSSSASQAARLGAQLPMAGLEVERSVELLTCSARANWSFETRAALARIRDEVKNINKLGRILNMVQHPSIAPPFLTAETRVDCNGKRGFTQASRGCSDVLWDAQREFPVAVTADGAQDARCMTGGNDDVFSYEVNPSDPYGWVCAFTPSQGLLLGYLWPRCHYPWVSLWCSSTDGEPRARGLEFGTTGLHQPFPILTRHPRIFGLPTFEHLDAMATFQKSFCCFLLEIPTDFCGVQAITVATGTATTLRLSEKGSERKFEVTVPDELV